MSTQYEIIVEPEHMPIDGNASAWGDEQDKEYAEWIRNELENGNQLAWCIITVKASIEGTDVEGTGTLCGCSYRSIEDFQKCLYFEDLKTEAKEDLLSKLESASIAFSKIQ